MNASQPPSVVSFFWFTYVKKDRRKVSERVYPVVKICVPSGSPRRCFDADSDPINRLRRRVRFDSQPR